MEPMGRVHVYHPMGPQIQNRDNVTHISEETSLRAEEPHPRGRQIFPAMGYEVRHSLSHARSK